MKNSSLVPSIPFQSMPVALGVNPSPHAHKCCCHRGGVQYLPNSFLQGLMGFPKKKGGYVFDSGRHTLRYILHIK